MRRIIIVLLLCTIFTKNNNAQTPEIDELKKSLETAKTDSVRIAILTKIATKHRGRNQDSLLHYANLLSKYDNLIAKRNCYSSYGIYHNINGNYDSCIYYFKLHLEITKQGNSKKDIAVSLSNLGAVNAQMGKFEKALGYFLDSEKIDDQIGRKNYSLKSNIGSLYHDIKNYKKSLEYFHKVLEYRISKSDSIRILTAYQNIEACHHGLNNFDSVFYYNKIGLTLSEKLNSHLISAIMYRKIANAYFNRDRLDSSYQYYKKAVGYFESNQSIEDLSYCYSGLGNIALKRGEFRDALALFNKSLEYHKQLNLKGKMSFVLLQKSKSLQHLKRYNDAYNSLLLSKSVGDSLLSTRSADALSEMQVKYETEKKEQELAFQAVQLSEQELKLNQQQLFRNIAIGGVIVLVLIIGLIYRNNRLKTKISQEISAKNEQLGKSLLERESLLKEIHHRVKNNLQIIASLLYLQSDDTENKSVKKLLEEGQGRVRSMALIHQKLYENDDLKSIPFEEYLQELIGEIQHSFGQSVENVQLEVNAKDIYFDVDTAVPLGLIINELSTNAFKYAYSKRLGGTFKVQLNKDGDSYKMEVADNGVGIPDDQLNNSNSKSLGLKLTKMLSDQLEGEYAFSNSGGTQFELKFAV